MAALHRGAYSKWTTKWTEDFVRKSIASSNPQWEEMLDDYVATVAVTPGTANFFKDPLRMLGTLVLVLRSATDDQKGVVLIKYNHVFPLFARFFDLETIAKRFHLVLEPSWSGYCDLNLLAYTRLKEPVFVQAIEPYDVRCLTSISSNLVPVPTSSNWWIDYNLIRPLPEVEKDCDVVMIAGWGSYKRHFRFFEAIAKLRRQGHRLRVLLLGYPNGWSAETILRHAAYFGVADQIELKERVPYNDMNAQINRAKVHVLWSRHEGFNRGIIEAMLAGLPCLLRAGFNYGFRYPYINPMTGKQVSEASLSHELLELVRTCENYSPREWIMSHMACEHACALLDNVIGLHTGDDKNVGSITPKVNALSSMRYMHGDDASMFTADCRYISEAKR
jgi:glycosyltransferase involved in cell wall biosynthesis